MKFAVVFLLCALSAYAVDAKKSADEKAASKANDEIAPAAPVPNSPNEEAESDNDSSESNAKIAAADQITANAFPASAKGANKVAQAEHDARLLAGAAHVQRANLFDQQRKERIAAKRLASAQRELLLNKNRAAHEEEIDRLKQQLEEHRAGVIAHRAALREHRKSVKSLRRLIKENNRKFRQEQRFLKNLRNNINPVSKLIQKELQNDEEN